MDLEFVALNMNQIGAKLLKDGIPVLVLYPFHSFFRRHITLYTIFLEAAQPIHLGGHHCNAQFKIFHLFKLVQHIHHPAAKARGPNMKLPGDKRQHLRSHP